MQSSTSVQDAQGNSYFVGATTTDIVPVTPGAFQTKCNGGICGYEEVPNTTNPGPPTYTSARIACSHAFAVKVSADGTQILYATYLEGSYNDNAGAAGVDSSGNLFINVTTGSPDFPFTSSIAGLPAQVSANGFTYAVVKLSADGSQLLFSDTYGLPGVQSLSGGSAVALLPDGKLLFGTTVDGTVFPTTPGAYLSARPNASLDVAIFIWDPQTNTIIHSTLIGGSDQDIMGPLKVDNEGNVYVTGYTISQDFPVTKGAFYSPGTVASRVNTFVAKLDATLSTLEFSSLFGGSYQPLPDAVALDGSGNVYVDGQTSPNMPVNPGAFETSYSGG